jgi:hypothetical protein
MPFRELFGVEIRSFVPNLKARLNNSLRDSARRETVGIVVAD